METAIINSENQGDKTKRQASKADEGGEAKRNDTESSVIVDIFLKLQAKRMKNGESLY